MALITSPTGTIPDLNYEYHTITVDTVGQTPNSFTCYLNQPLRNVVQARLLAARINTVTPANGSEHCYVSIKELDSIFSDRASKNPPPLSDGSIVRNSFASLVTTDDTGIISFRDNYPIATQYIDPIRSIDRLTVSIRNEDGVLISPPNPAENNFLILRFVCRKPNM
ncbi:hypothetical protein FK873_gp101 [Micromonas pusilla virus SP1]|jgi:hypothetical protein|uniref:Uncharacterized protein n=1 Tax=Micromonas pusilla virus SP1 TaxID=373996 RepID=G9E5W8_MPSP1|nr:hypothetical protein FK873_gp101 [Micromonas pusilla virus SP1]AET85037.1 hypothetical protein MPXG_00239 [Micromonas pusilla virus SP1]